jgi:hypothetical protein
MKTAIFLSLGLALLLVTGCAQVPREPLLLDPQFAQLGIREITLLPVEFADQALDRQLQSRVAEEIPWHAARALQAKGYEVRHAQEITAEPTMVIRIDQFLDAGLADRHQTPLELYATATLWLNGGILWQGEGVGRGEGSLANSTPRQMEWYFAPRSLVESLFATLPPTRD